MIKTIVQSVRIGVFYTVLGLYTIFWTLASLLIAPFLPTRRRLLVVQKWYCVALCWLAKVVCGIRWHLEGIEHIPEGACVIVSNHQSAWETFFIPMLMSPQTQVLKRELLHVPFFGWCFRLLSPIAIDRNRPKRAMEQLMEQGTTYLQQGIRVLVFPEGTRQKSKQLGRFARGGANLALRTGAPLLPIAHNSGHYWLSRPGCIKVIIGPAIETADKSADEVNKVARQWIESTMRDRKML